MKKNVLLLIFVILFGTDHLWSQCQTTFTCFAFPAAAIPGKVVIYRKNINDAKMDSISYMNVSTSSFTVAIPDSGRYILKYIPTSTSYQISYADTAKSWIDATVYNNFCGTGYFANFACQPYGTTGGTGSGSLSGHVIEGTDYKPKGSQTNAPGSPIGGIVVKGGKNPGGQLFAQTTTDYVTGAYSFNNLPAGDYFVLVDIPGLDTINPWYVTLNNNNQGGLDYIADSIKVLGGGGLSSVNEINKDKYNVSLSPNPTQNQFTIKYTLSNHSTIRLELFDYTGRKVKEYIPQTNQVQGEHREAISISDLKSGLYFVKLYINEQEIVSKLLITK